MIVGIDPGLGGCTVVLNRDGTVFKIIPHSHTPTDIWNYLKGGTGEDSAFVVDYAAIEQVHGVKGWNANASNKLMFQFGTMFGMLTALECRIELVTPPKWMSTMHCLTGGDKNISKTMAGRLFPGVSVTLTNADALLIAEYARRRAIELGLIHVSPLPVYYEQEAAVAKPTMVRRK